MKNRIMAMILFVALILGSTAPFAYAVSPADPLIASALYSFLVSAGIKLWRDGVEGSDTAVNDMIDDMKTIWGFYKDDRGANVPSWSSIAGITTNNGNIILNYDTAQTFQAFADWLKDYKSMKPGNTYAITSEQQDPSGYALFTLPSDETAGLNKLNAGVWAMPVSFSDTLSYGFGDPDSLGYRLGTFRPSSNCVAFFMASGDITYIYFADIQSFNVVRTIDYPNKEDSTPSTFTYNSSSASIGGVSRPNNGTMFNFNICLAGSLTSSYTIHGPVNASLVSGENPSYEMAYVALAGDPIGTAADLFATVGFTVADKVGDLISGQSLAIDVGASVGADEEDIIATTAFGYSVPATADVVPSAVAAPVPIAGAQELYPQAQEAVDVDNLGLPALGQALTTRFPFCIPWDVVYLYQSLNATPQRPVIDIDLFPSGFKQKVGITANTSFSFDLGDEKYSMLLKVIRWSTLVGFVLCLAFATKRLIWTTGG